MGMFGAIKNWVMPADEDEMDGQLPAGTGGAVSENGRVKIRIQTPRDFVETTGLLDDLKVNNCVLVNLNQADQQTRRRIYDYLDGACSFAGGTIGEVAEEVYMFSLQQGCVEKKFTGQGAAFTIDEIKKRHNLI